MYVESIALGLEVYGQEQVDYTVNGTEHKLFAEAANLASIERAESIEQGVAAYQALIKKRLAKMEELGKTLANVSEAAAKLAKGESTDTVTLSSLKDTAAVLSKYGVKSYITADGTISKADVDRQTQEIQHVLDMDDNNVQQDLTSIQDFMSKRDKAFQLAAKLSDKAIGTLSQVVQRVS